MNNTSTSALLSGTWIAGAQYECLRANLDERGSFTEIFYSTWNTGVEPVQWSAVKSRAGVLRGMHLHLRHDEYICVLGGKACVGLYDLRKSSPTYKAHTLVELEGNAPARLSFPAGVLHAWYFFEESIHVQAISETFETYGSDDNWGCYFGDPELGIPWPNLDPILSERARSFPGLRKLEQMIDQYTESTRSGGAPSENIIHYADTEVV